MRKVGVRDAIAAEREVYAAPEDEDIAERDQRARPIEALFRQHQEIK